MTQENRRGVSDAARPKRIHPRVWIWIWTDAPGSVARASGPQGSFSARHSRRAPGLMGFGPPGFLNAPASKLVTCGCAAATLAAHLLGVADDLALTPGAVARLHLPRVLASHVVFASPGEAVFGLYLLYHFRVFERQRGTRRYAVFAAVAAALAIAAQVATTALVGSFDPSGGSASSSLAGTHRLLAPRRGRGGGGPPLLASGPHALIWAHVAPFRRDVPSAYHFTVFGVRFSDKAFVYLAAIQLALSRWPSGVAPSLVGLIVGYALDHRRRGPPHASASSTRGGGTTSTGSASPTPLRWVDDWTPPVFVRRFIRATVGRALEGAAARSDSEEASSGTRDPSIVYIYKLPINLSSRPTCNPYQ